MRSLKRQAGFLGSVVGSIGKMLGGSGVGSIVGSVVSGLFGSAGQSSANEANMAMSREQREWQENMSNTAYQRATKDMMAAGLNPMLAYTQGGASTPTGGIGNPIINRATAAADAVNKIASSAASYATTELLKEQAVKTQAEVKNIEADTLVKGSQLPLNEQYRVTSAASADKLVAETHNLRFQLTNILPAQADQMSTQALLNNVRAALEKERTLTEPVRRHLIDLESKLMALSIPEAQNRSDAQSSWWMRNISPYLPDALKSSTILRRSTNH